MKIFHTNFESVLDEYSEIFPSSFVQNKAMHSHQYVLTLCHPGFLILVFTRGGSSGPTDILWFFGAILRPLVSMLNHIQNKGVITDHVEKKFRKNIENPLLYGVFRLQGEQMKFFENIFFLLKTLISGSNLNGLSSSFLQTSTFFQCKRILQ